MLSEQVGGRRCQSGGVPPRKLFGARGDVQLMKRNLASNERPRINAAGHAKAVFERRQPGFDDSWEPIGLSYIQIVCRFGKIDHR
jgi:hypothetical protein